MSETPSQAEQLAAYVATWHRACADLTALARTLPEDKWHLPTDLEGWDVIDNVAHTAHLEAVLAGAPEETVEVPESAHIKSLTGLYTEQGVLARRGRDMTALADEIDSSVATRYADLQADPPTEFAATPPRTPGGVPWDTGTLLGNRPLDVWMHEQDIRRAVGKPGGFDSPAAAHTIHRLGGGLPMVLGKRVGAAPGTSVRIDLPERDLSFGAVVGDDGRAKAAEVDDPTVVVELSDEDFILLAGGRRGRDAVNPSYAGDRALGEKLVDNLAVTP